MTKFTFIIRTTGLSGIFYILYINNVIYVFNIYLKLLAHL